jgi:predicted Zn-dependent protease
MRWIVPVNQKFNGCSMFKRPSSAQTVHMAFHLFVAILMFVLKSVQANQIRVFFHDNVRGFECELMSVLESLNDQVDVLFTVSDSMFLSDVEVALGSTDHGWGKTVISHKTFVILSEKIKWTTDDGCDNSEMMSTARVPIKMIFLHEMMHVLGFDHVADEKSIMFFDFRCQTFGPDDISNLHSKFGHSKRVDIVANDFFFSKQFQKVFLEINSKKQ